MDNTVIEGNKLIAEFMGDTKYEAYRIFGPENYDKDWNELMQVVEKIESMKFWVRICLNECSISNMNDPNFPDVVNITKDDADTKIEAVWQAVVQLIQWYNNNQKSPQ